MRRLLVLACAVVLVDTAFYAVVAPLLPELEDELGLTKTEAGILVGAYPAGTLVAALPSGLLVSRFGARRIVVLGLLLMAGSSVAFAVLREPLLLDLSRFVQGVGGACSWAGALAWVIGAAPPDRRGALIGTTLAAGIAGALLGPVLGALAGALGDEPVFFAVAAVGGVLALLAAREPTPAPAAARERARDLGVALRRHDVARGMWLVALPALGFGVMGTLVPLRLDDLGATQTAVAAAFLVAAVVEASVSPVVGRISDRRGRLVPVRIGLTVSTVLLVVVPLPGAALGVAALLVVATAGLGTFWAPSMAALSDAADTAGVSQGPAMALVNFAWAIGQTIGSAAGGGVADVTADVVPFAVVAALCALTLAVLRRIPTDEPTAAVRPL
ncbi:MFS transporter [Conexibacter sp. SYSU D00693]|uniref:MFS transporter n=1 Tax=Conexibacter sp. SYSU D00693 TaxID=2812560 RepID=UPI00196B793A|nr:MFS transporter [Conexibacter sp. SYSU D00693]